MFLRTLLAVLSNSSRFFRATMLHTRCESCANLNALSWILIYNHLHLHLINSHTVAKLWIVRSEKDLVFSSSSKLFCDFTVQAGYFVEEQKKSNGYCMRVKSFPMHCSFQMCTIYIKYPASRTLFLWNVTPPWPLDLRADHMKTFMSQNMNVLCVRYRGRFQR